MDSSVKSIIARINNAVIEGLNNRARLPRYLVVIIDQDMIRELMYSNKKLFLNGVNVLNG